MPCRYDYMEPNVRERYNQLTAQLWAFTLQRMKDLDFTTVGQAGIDQVVQIAKDIYCTHDYTPQLCATLNGLTQNELDAIVYDAKNPMSRKLADWWEQHQKTDDNRLVEFQLKTNAIRKSMTDIERAAETLDPSLQRAINEQLTELHHILASAKP